MKQWFASLLGLEVIVEDDFEKLFRDLAGIYDPELKLKVIRSAFVDVFDNISRSISVPGWLRGLFHREHLGS